MQLVWHSVAVNLTVNLQLPTLGRDRTLWDLLEVICSFFPTEYCLSPLIMSGQTNNFFGTKFNPSLRVTDIL